MSKAEIWREAQAVRPLVQSACVLRWLDAVQGLPEARACAVYVREGDRRVVCTEEEYGRLESRERVGWVRRVFPESFFYTTFGGTPVALGRALDVCALVEPEVLREGESVLEFGYGTLGVLRLYAQLGMDAVGVDPSPLLRALYSAPEDQGVVRGWGGVRGGSVRLVSDTLPMRASREVGGGYGLLMCKNVLKRGYLLPRKEEALVRLGGSLEAFAKEAARLLRPGGLWMVYNVCAPFREDVPASDGRCPWVREVLEGVGFDVQEFDRDDTPAIRAWARCLGWPDASSGYCASYTLMRRVS